MPIIHKKLPIVKSKGTDPTTRPLGGTIINWQIHPNTAGGFTGYGILVKDLLHRFVNGTDIHTSNIEEFYYDTDELHGWIITRNTKYLLGTVKEEFNFKKLEEQLNQF